MSFSVRLPSDFEPYNPLPMFMHHATITLRLDNMKGYQRAENIKRKVQAKKYCSNRLVFSVIRNHYCKPEMKMIYVLSTQINYN